jgi:phospholipid/cholesterol/gamma-HCH transport system substrate-binding protein
MQQARSVGVGIFVLGGLLLFGFGLFMIGDRRNLFETSFEVYTEFARLGGLEPGAKVRVAGRDGGEVVRIDYPVSPTAKFRVRMRVLEALHPLVRTDSVASIQNDGLVGNKLVVIATGSEAAPEAPPESTLTGRDPFELADLLDKASATVDTVDRSIIQIRDELEQAVIAARETVEHANEFVETAGQNVEAITASGRQITEDVRVMVADTRAGRGSLGKFIREDAMYEDARRIVGEIEQASRNLREVSDRAREVMARFQAREGPAEGLFADFRETLAAAREAMSDLGENMESLKRSFFFRGFFLNRGFYDLDLMTVAEYRSGALRDKNLGNLRMWYEGTDLFESVPEGGEQLSGEGKKKLDSAMAEILRYPSTSPLIVEGYAKNCAPEDCFLRARQRAAQARQYLATKYFLNASHTGVMPMVGYEPEGVSAGSGEGIVLSLFYNPKAEIAPRPRTVND